MHKIDTGNAIAVITKIWNKKVWYILVMCIFICISSCFSEEPSNMLVVKSVIVDVLRWQRISWCLNSCISKMNRLFVLISVCSFFTFLMSLDKYTAYTVCIYVYMYCIYIYISVFYLVKITGELYGRWNLCAQNLSCINAIWIHMKVATFHLCG